VSSLNSSVSTVDLALKPSARAFHMLLVLHGATLFALPFVVSEGPALIVIAALIGISWLYCRRHAALGFGKRGMTRILFGEDGQWRVQLGAGALQEAKLLSGSIVRGRWLLLSFELAKGGKHSRLLLGDETDAEALRRLRARLATVSP
jgi:hypothetical protein